MGQELFLGWEGCNGECSKKHQTFCREIKIILPSQNSPLRSQMSGFRCSHSEHVPGTKLQVGSLQIFSCATLLQPPEAGFPAPS
jgi:hypothetical protein